MVMVVAAPPKLIVVAVVLSRSNDVEAVVMLVLMAGEMLKTALAPVEYPVSSDRTVASSADVVEAN
jgi:hypothetical protein